MSAGRPSREATRRTRWRKEGRKRRRRKRREEEGEEKEGKKNRKTETRGTRDKKGRQNTWGYPDNQTQIKRQASRTSNAIFAVIVISFPVTLYHNGGRFV